MDATDGWTQGDERTDDTRTPDGRRTEDDDRRRATGDWPTTGARGMAKIRHRAEYGRQQQLDDGRRADRTTGCRPGGPELGAIRS